MKKKLVRKAQIKQLAMEMLIKTLEVFKPTIIKMKSRLLLIILTLSITGLFTSCNEEEVSPQSTNQTVSHGNADQDTGSF